jgi:hypothetical protein
MSETDWILTASTVFGGFLFEKLSRMSRQLDLIAKDLRAIREQDLPNIHRKVDAAIDGAHDPRWRQ